MSKLVSYFKTRAFRNNLLIAIVSVFVVVLVIIFSLNFYTRHGEGLPVPKLKGLSIEKAVEILESAGFQYQIDSVYQADKPPGLVVEQDPDPNTNVKNNRTIYLTIITRMAPNVGFPDVLNLTFLEAQSILSSYGLKVGDTTYVSDIAKDRVLDMKFGGVNVKKGQNIPKGSKIDLVLGDGMGASDVDLPDLTGLSVNEAKFSLKGASLSLGLITYEGTITDSLNLKIIKQTPALSDSISKVPIGTKVDVVVSN